MTLISPWTGYLVHATYFIREIMFMLGFASVVILASTIPFYCACEEENWLKRNFKSYAMCMVFVVAAAIGTHLVIPPAEVMARIAIVHQLPEDADAEVVDELVRLVCKESVRL
jgi:hypothetical protein